MWSASDLTPCDGGRCDPGVSNCRIKRYDLHGKVDGSRGIETLQSIRPSISRHYLSVTLHMAGAALCNPDRSSEVPLLLRVHPDDPLTDGGGGALFKSLEA